MPRKNLKTGGCGCQQTSTVDIQKGGSILFDTNNKYTNPLFNVVDDPSDPSKIISTRLLPQMTGGENKHKSKVNKSQKKKLQMKKNKTKKMKKMKMKKIKKGGNNIVSTFYTTAGTPYSANMVLANRINAGEFPPKIETPFV
jgi:hypothetical protein